MVDFNLSEAQKQLQHGARQFAHTVLAKTPAVYNAYATQNERFQSLRPTYRTAVSAGLIKGQVPIPLGGSAAGLLDSAIVVEEFFAVEPTAAITILGTGLGLTPLILAGNTEQHDRLLKPFLSGEGEPIASFVHSEPGGTANWLEKGAPGLETTARRDGDDWIINGEKVSCQFPLPCRGHAECTKLWATNCSGWDDCGADIQCVVCRQVGDDVSADDDPVSRILIIIVTRMDIVANDPGAYEVLSHPELTGFNASNGPHCRFMNLRVAGKNLLAPPGKGAQVVEQTFGSSAAIVSAMAVGIMRAAFEVALSFAKRDTRGGMVPIIQHQSVADLLIDIKGRIEASRVLTWKALHTVEHGPGDWNARLELALHAKIFASDHAVQSVVDAMKVVGIKAYAKDMPLQRMLNDAMVLPLFDGGNTGVRRRQLEKIFQDDGYKPWSASFGA
jgi:alkylation response protein AidB-like acyl-CoA dehydrogenase